MPSNFDLTTLNGVRFDPGNIAFVGSAQAGADATQAVINSVGAQGGVTTLAPDNSARIIAATNDYRASYVGTYGNTYLPVLGTITFEGGETWNVVGFSDDDLLITQQAHVAAAPGGASGYYTLSAYPHYGVILSADPISSGASDVPITFQPDAAAAGYAAPSPATNPFDISVLDGVTFDADQIGFVPSTTGGGPSAAGGLQGSQAWAVNDPGSDYSGGIVRGVPVIYGAADGVQNGFGTVDPPPVTIVNNFYDPGFVDSGGWYHPPRFGTIAFGSDQYDIRGFGEDGRSILLTPAGNGNNATTDAMLDSGAFVISFDTLPIYTSSNPPAGIPYRFGSDADDVAAFQSAVCFAEGTRIATPEGAVAVEALAEGGAVLTASGAVRLIKWIGQMLSRPARHPRPWEVQPVRVKAHAFAPDCPVQDVRLSPGHAVYVDGVLVPVGKLVNGATIVQEEVEQIRYFHVELDTHDVLLAEGLPCESYLDDGNRKSFANGGGNTELHGRLDPKSWDNACAPMVAAGPQLVAVQQRLHRRAEELGWVRSEEADLAIVADGAEIAPTHRSGNRFWFCVPVASSLTLRSNSAVLAHVMPGLGDFRTLGVAVAELRVDGVPLDLDDAAFDAGFHPAERHEEHGWRWTNGAATIAHRFDAPTMVEVSLAMVVPAWTRSATELKLVANR